MIREFMDSDIEILKSLHKANGLPANCLPDHDDPLFLVKSVLEHEGKPMMASFLKITSEVYLLVDHEEGTPEQRWAWVQELTEHMKREAWAKGLNEMSCWIPPAIEKSFGKRLTELGFVKSPWQSYTLNLIGLNDAGRTPL
jgi:hypothetical protein